MDVMYFMFIKDVNVLRDQAVIESRFSLSNAFRTRHKECFLKLVSSKNISFSAFGPGQFNVSRCQSLARAKNCNGTGSDDNVCGALARIVKLIGKPDVREESTTKDKEKTYYIASILSYVRICLAAAMANSSLMRHNISN